jgi:hypothetical protein
VFKCSMLVKCTSRGKLELTLANITAKRASIERRKLIVLYYYKYSA